MKINERHITKSVDDIFLWYKYPFYVNDISRNQLVRYFCGTIFPAMSMISHKIIWWDIFVVEMIQVIPVIQLIQDNQVRVAHLWADFRVICADVLGAKSTVVSGQLWWIMTIPTAFIILLLGNFCSRTLSSLLNNKAASYSIDRLIENNLKRGFRGGEVV